jgi:hypothetical protein
MMVHFLNAKATPIGRTLDPIGAIAPSWPVAPHVPRFSRSSIAQKTRYRASTDVVYAPRPPMKPRLAPWEQGPPQTATCGSTRTERRVSIRAEFGHRTWRTGQTDIDYDKALMLERCLRRRVNHT